MENQRLTRQCANSKYTQSESKSFQNAVSMIEDSVLHTSLKACGEQNKSIDYDLVIKQFDDLISELSFSSYVNKKYSKNSDNVYGVEKNSKVIQLDSKGENVDLCERNCIDSAFSEKIQLCNLRNRILQTESNSTDHSYVSDPVQCKLSETLPNNKQNSYSLPKSHESIPWINSHLWQNENKAQFLEAHKSKMKNLPINISPVNSKTNIKPSEYSTRTLENCKIFNLPFYSKHYPRKNVDYPCYKSNSAFAYKEDFFKGKSPSSFEFQDIKVRGASSPMLSKFSKSSASKYIPSNCFVVKLYIETKDLHLGPFSFEIYSKMSLRLLKLKVEKEHGISVSSQRWILGKCFAVDNDKSLADYNVMPGSSIILYVDKKKEISSDTTENEFEVSKVNKPCKEKEKSDSFDSLIKESYFRESKELIRKDSLDSKLSHLCGENNPLRYRKLSNQSSDSSSIDVPIKEQKTHCVLQKDAVCEKVKSPVAKKKVIKKNIEPKKKTKIVIHQKPDVPAYMEKLLAEKQNFDSFEGYAHSVSSNGNPKGTVRNDSSDFVNIRSMHEDKPNYSESVSSTSIGNAPNSKADIFTQHNQYITSDPVLFNTSNISEKDNSSFSENLTLKNLKGFSEYININSEEDSNIFRNKPKDLIFSVEVKQNVNEPSVIPFEKTESMENINIKMQDPLFHENRFITEVKNTNYIHEHDNEALLLTKKLGNVDQFLTPEKNEKEESVSKTIGFGESKENVSTTVKSDYPDHVKEPENLLLSGRHSAENMLENSEEYLERREYKPKKSITSIIRKLSLTRKGKCSTYSTNSHNATSSKVNADVMADSNHPTVNSSQSIHCDIHLEISPENSSVLLENENTEHTDYNLQEDPVQDAESIKNFELLMEIENMDLVENTTNFTCPVCFDEFESGQGVILHDCLHTFCRECLSNSVSYSDSALVKCPYRDDLYSCQSCLQQREIKALVSEDVYEKYLHRSIITAEGLAERSFHCKTPDCPGWCVYDNEINIFHCPVCFHYNCLNCQAIHEGLNCRQYQDKLKLQQKVDKESEKTLELLNKMIESGKALRCPTCDLILMKKWGCDWLKCSICKTEICWITKGPRWGPGGQGDTSGGCKCGVNGVKCHPSCTYCH